MTQTIKKREYETTLPCILTKKERLAAADKLGESAKELQHARSDKNAAAKKLKAAEAEHEKLSEIVSSGKEYREVRVEVLADFEAGILSHVRVDTGEVYIEEKMSYQDRQMALTESANE